MKFKPLLRWSAYAFGSLLFLLVAALVSINASFKSKKNQIYKTGDIAIWEIDRSTKAVSEGGRLVTFRGCIDCHGKDLGGKIMINDPAIGTVIAPNITKGAGGLPADWSMTDWVRALKHGVNRQGNSLLIMPSYETAKLSQQDMGAIIAYVEQVAPVNKTWEQSSFGYLGKLLSILDELPTFVATKLDHQAALIPSVEARPEAAYGAYLAVSCTGCHKADFKGGKHPVPGMPEVPNITSKGVMAQHQLDSFDRFMRTGKNHKGRQVEPAAMPWPLATVLTAVEMEALYLYLKSL